LLVFVTDLYWSWAFPLSYSYRLAYEALQQGKLVRVLNDYIIPHADFWIVWPSSQHLTPKTRAFIDFISDAFSNSDALRDDQP